MKAAGAAYSILRRLVACNYLKIHVIHGRGSGPSLARSMQHLQRNTGRQATEQSPVTPEIAFVHGRGNCHV